MLKWFSVFRFEHGWLLFCIVATFHAIINFYFQRFSSSHPMLFLFCRSNDFRTITTLYAISIATYLLLFWVLRYAFLNNTSLRINVLAYVLVYRLKISHSTNKHLFKSSFSFNWHFVLLHFWMNVWECVCVHIYIDMDSGGTGAYTIVLMYSKWPSFKTPSTTSTKTVTLNWNQRGKDGLLQVGEWTKQWERRGTVSKFQRNLIISLFRVLSYYLSFFFNFCFYLIYDGNSISYFSMLYCLGFILMKIKKNVTSFAS